MPNTKSAEKALRQSFRRQKQNIRRKEAYKSVAKNLLSLAGSDKKNEATELLPALYQAIDKAAKTRVIAKNKAARMKSRFTKLVRAPK